MMFQNFSSMIEPPEEPEPPMACCACSHSVECECGRFFCIVSLECVEQNMNETCSMFEVA